MERHAIGDAYPVSYLGVDASIGIAFVGFLACFAFLLKLGLDESRKAAPAAVRRLQPIHTALLAAAFDFRNHVR